MILYTAIFGGRDVLRPPLFVSDDVRFTCFTDDSRNVAPGVDTKVVNLESGTTPKRASQFCKLNPPPHDDSLWIDGSYQLIADPRPYFNEMIAAGCNVALGQHPQRHCAYAEAEVCCRHSLDDPGLIRRQMGRYRDAGLPQRFGLWEGGMIFRRTTPDVAAWQRLWWEEICVGSRRDQLSLPYTLWKTGLAVHTLPPRVPELLRFFDHGKASR